MEALPQLPVSQAEAVREAARKSAMFSGGHKFIALLLVNTRFLRISGIEYVHATPYIDERAGNITKFHLEVKGGSMDFQYDAGRGSFRYQMLDSPHNRSFLASHYHLGYWEIEDDKINDEIGAMSSEIEAQVKQVEEAAPAPAPKTAKAPVVAKKKARGRPFQKKVQPQMEINSDLVTPVARVNTP